MQPDLVQRLRMVAKGVIDGDAYPATMKAVQEAADEIVRLRRELDAANNLNWSARYAALEEAAKVAELHGPYAIARAIRALKEKP